MSRLPNHIIEKIHAARKAATLESASFGFPNDNVKSNQLHHDAFDGHPDDFIKDRVELYHATWIIGPLDDVLKWAAE